MMRDGSFVILLLCLGVLTGIEATECGTKMQSEGILTSPGYPNPYNMTSCTSTITAPVNKRVRLTLQEIDTYTKSTCNRKSDTIQINDKVSNKFELSRSWCGKQLPSDNVFISTQNAAKIQFEPNRVDSNYTNTHTGFKILVEFEDVKDSTTTSATISATTSTIATSTTSGSTSTTATPTTTSSTPSSDSSCGISKYSDAGKSLGANAKIIGGDEARSYEFPWLVSLYLVETGRHFCGGSILDKNTIVTAAHCITGVVGEWNLRVAVHVNDVNTRADAQVFQVTNIIRHSFDASTYKNDISLIKLSGNITFNAETRPICYPDAGNLYTHQTAVIAGWGKIDDGSLPSRSNYARVNITTNAECNDMMSAAIANPWTVYDSMVCASDNNGNNDIDTCQGDSGGPMAVKGADGRFRLVGITSWGYGCASGTPGVYTRVTSFLNWINNNI